MKECPVAFTLHTAGTDEGHQLETVTGPLPSRPNKLNIAKVAVVTTYQLPWQAAQAGITAQGEAHVAGEFS